MKKKYIIVNWKMNGNKAFIDDYAKNFDKKLSDMYNFIIAPSSPYLQYTIEKFSDKNVNIAAQNMSNFKNGAYTGQFSSQMLDDLEVRYVIIGHSEERKFLLKSNEDLAQKIINADKYKLKTIYCIGEDENCRTKNAYQEYIFEQLSIIPNEIFHSANIDIAYEPIWSIGTGKSAKTGEIAEISDIIDEYFAKKGKKVNIFYGGSVNLENYKDIINLPNISGLLIGKMGLDVKNINKLLDN